MGSERDAEVERRRGRSGESSGDSSSERDVPEARAPQRAGVPRPEQRDAANPQSGSTGSAEELPGGQLPAEATEIGAPAGDPVWRAGHDRLVTHAQDEALPGLNTWGAEVESVEEVDDDEAWAPTSRPDSPPGDEDQPS
jgi:hypothetical protein